MRLAIKNLLITSIALAALGYATPSSAQAFWGNGALPSGAASTTGDCSSAIQQQQAAMQAATVAGDLALANSTYLPMPAAGFNGLSCLDNLLNGGLNIIFEPPSLDALLSMLEQAVCTEATSMISQATQPLMNDISGITSGGGGALSGVSNIVPGVNLSSVVGGLSFNQTSGGSSIGIAGGQSVNVSGLFSSSSLFGSGTTNLGNNSPINNGLLGTATP